MKRALFVNGNRFSGDVNDGGKGFSAKWRAVEWSCKTIQPFGTLIIYDVRPQQYGQSRFFPVRIVCNLRDIEEAKAHTKLEVETHDEYNDFFGSQN